jgi:hypothetical protein
LFLLAGFIVTVLNITLNKESENIQDVISNYHIIFSFTFLLLGFIIAISCMLKTSQYKNFVKNDGVIKFRDQDELIILM